MLKNKLEVIMNTAMDLTKLDDDVYEERKKRISNKYANISCYESITDKYVQEIKEYDETLGKPSWIKYDTKHFGVGNAVLVKMIEHKINPDYYVAYFLTPAGYICMQRHTSLDTWENLCSDKPAPEWFVSDAKHIKNQNMKKILYNVI
jgi:hypothetical protein